MNDAHAILETKGHDVISVTPEATVFAAIQRMSDYGIGALLVMQHDNLVGIISERDYARKVILVGRSSKECAVREVMTADVIGVTSSDTTQHCLDIMTQKRVRHLPVMNDGKVVGMLSIGDLVKAIMAEQAKLISQLQQYITG